MRIEREDLLRLDASLRRTWLETDGLGGYAASTVLACATSRYHGLLVAPPRPGAPRHVFLSRFEEHVGHRGREIPLSMAKYPGVHHPAGHSYVSDFELAPYPTWRYGIGEVDVVREVMMPGGGPVVMVRWRVTGGPGPYTLALRPFLPCREADALTYRNDRLSPVVSALRSGVAARPYASLPAVSLTWSGPRARFVADPQWYERVEFDDDLARGYEGREDQFSPGRIEFALAPGDEIVVAATIGEPVPDPRAAWREASRRRRAGTSAASGLRPALERAAEQFLFRDAGGRLGVVAGFPWFGEWGRDTCVSLPGLLLPRGRVDECGDALAALRPWLRGGRLPNRFGATPAASEYAAADPALWFARAVRLWEVAGGSGERLAREFLPALAEIADGHRAAAGGDLAFDEATGLLRGATGASAATWMDANPGGPVTPREGCAVEVNALWYFLLAYLARIARRAGHPRRREWRGLAARVGRSFLDTFWLEAERRLADVVDAGRVDASVRPNMVIAAALEFSPLSKGRRSAVVDLARAELLTPRGLRTLSPRHPAYRGRYEGDVRSRDAAYHQGTAWPWLLGAYCEAYVRAHGRGPGARRHLREVLGGFAPALEERALGQVAEVYDGDPPQRAGGAWAQAWSVAELLRAHGWIGRRR